MSTGREFDLRRATIVGARWMAASRLATETAALASVVVLARLISPAEFGRAAVALVFVGVAVILGPPGLTAVLVQRPVVSRSHVESAAGLSVGLGTGLSILTLLFAKTAAVHLFDERTADLVALASPAWILAGIGGVSQALVQRDLRFGRTASIDSVGAVLGSATSVLLAIAGVEGPALVAGALVLVGAGSLVALVSVPVPAPRLSRTALRELVGFTAPVTLSSLVYLGFRHVDYLILGMRMRAEQVGFYWRAYQVGVDYQAKISQVMLRVSFPVFSRATDLDELKRIRLRIVRTHATVIVPLLAGFVAVAPTLVPWLFGAAWEPAVRPAQIMAVAGMADAVTTGLGPLTAALGRPKLLLVWNVAELAAYAAVIALLAPFGLIWVATGVAFFGIASVVFIQVVIMPHLIGLGLASFWSEVRAGVLTGGVALAVVSGARILLEDAGVSAGPALAALLVLGVATYAVALRFLFEDAWRELFRLVRSIAAR